MNPELEIIAMIREMVGEGSAGVVRGIGDDCAIIACGNGSLLVSTDTLVQGVHFDLAWHPPRDLGHKCAAVNLSDIAAMGGRPGYAFLSLGLPEADYRFCREFMEGFIACLGENGAVLAGGDTVHSPVYSFTITVIGEAVGAGPLQRSGAGAGDEILVSGYLGEAAAGLELFKQGIDDPAFAGLFRAHLAPEPRVSLGQVLAASGLVRSLIDLSDGVACDLAHICRESGLAAEIEADMIPVSPALGAAAAKTGHDPLALAVSGGEDYELLATVAPDDAEALLCLAREKGFRLHRIGRMVEGSGVWLCEEGGRREITDRGFDHFLNP